MNTWFRFICFIVLNNYARCFPAITPESLAEIRDEEHYPNGSVIGKYSYKDDQGNPVHVKYFADDTSYGVELKSVKALDSTELSNKLENLSKPLSTQYKFTNDLFNANFPFKSSQPKISPYYFLRRDLGGKTLKPFKSEIFDSDFDVYYQNDLTNPKHCKNEKSRLQKDKEKRKARSIVDSFHADKFCRNL